MPLSSFTRARLGNVSRSFCNFGYAPGSSGRHVGWFEWRRHWVYVLPDAVLGDIDNTREETIVLDTTAGQHGFHQSGTNNQWRDHIAKPLARNSNVILATGVFLAAPLLRWANEPPAGLHSWARSKIGKTLAAAFGQSLYGKPYRQGA